jgi:hypothetical protein
MDDGLNKFLKEVERANQAKRFGMQGDRIDDSVRKISKNLEVKAKQMANAARHSSVRQTQMRLPEAQRVGNTGYRVLKGGNQTLGYNKKGERLSGPNLRGTFLHKDGQQARINDPDARVGGPKGLRMAREAREDHQREANRRTMQNEKNLVKRQKELGDKPLFNQKRGLHLGPEPMRRGATSVRVGLNKSQSRLGGGEGEWIFGAGDARDTTRYVRRWQDPSQNYKMAARRKHIKDNPNISDKDLIDKTTASTKVMTKKGGWRQYKLDAEGIQRMERKANVKTTKTVDKDGRVGYRMKGAKMHGFNRREELFKQVTVAKRSGIAKLLDAEGFTNAKLPQQRERLESLLDELQGEMAREPTLKQHFSAAEADLRNQHDHVKREIEKTAGPIDKKVARLYDLDEEQLDDHDRAIRARRHGPPIERHVRGLGKPRSPSMFMHDGLAAGESEANRIVQDLNDTLERGGKVDMKKLQNLEKHDGMRIRTMDAFHPGFKAAFLKANSASWKKGGLGSLERAEKELARIQKWSVMVGPELGLPSGVVPRIGKIAKHLRDLPHGLSSDAIIKSEDMQRVVGKVVPKEIRGEFRRLRPLTSTHHLNEQSLMKLAKHGFHVAEFGEQAVAEYTRGGAQKIYGPTATGERVHSEIGSGRNMSSTPLAKQHYNNASELRQAAGLDGKYAFEDVHLRDYDLELNRRIQRQEKAVAGEFGGAGRMKVSPLAFVRSQMKLPAMHSHGIPGAVRRVGKSGRVSFTGRDFMGSINKALYGSPVSRAHLKGGRVFPDLNARSTGNPDLAAITGIHGYGEGVDARRAAFAARDDTDAEIGEAHYEGGLIVYDVKDVSVMRKLERVIPNLVRDAADMLATGMWKASMEVLARRGMEPRWVPNAKRTSMRKGSSDAPMLESGELARAIHVVAKHDYVQDAPGSYTSYRYLGWDDDLHPVDKLGNRTTDDKRFSMSELAALNEFGGTHGQDADGPIRIPSRPWLSRAADLFGPRMLDETANYVLQRLGKYKVKGQDMSLRMKGEVMRNSPAYRMQSKGGHFYGQGTPASINYRGMRDTPAAPGPKLPEWDGSGAPGTVNSPGRQLRFVPDLRQNGDDAGMWV